MKKRILSTFAKQVICAVLFVQLAGCGTLLRSESSERIYRGVDTDIKNASNAYMWLFSVGVLPVFSVISLPFDAVIDTVLLPVDIAVSKSPTVNTQPTTNFIPIFSVNMTSQPDVNYIIRKKSTGEILTQSRSSIIPQAGSASGKIDTRSLLTENNPLLPPESVTISWNNVKELPIAKSTDTRSMVKSFTPDNYLREAASVIVLFMPCNRVMLINNKSGYYHSEFVEQKPVKELFQQLNFLAEQSQCSASGQVKLSMEGVWQ